MISEETDAVIKSVFCLCAVVVGFPFLLIGKIFVKLASINFLVGDWIGGQIDKILDSNYILKHYRKHVEIENLNSHEKE